MISRCRILIFLTLCGLLLNLLLLYWKLSDFSAGIPGCGAGNACGDVFTSHWSLLMGLPLPVFGVAVYILLGIALLGGQIPIAAFCYASVAGSAVWLTIVQAVVLHHFCTWCMAAHAVGCVVALLGITNIKLDPGSRFGLQLGTAAAFTLALVQIHGPSPATHRIDGEMNVAISRTAGIHAQGTGRKVAFADGRKVYDCTPLPHLGSTDARYVMVEYFDYLCPSCHTMRAYLSALVRKHPAEVCILLLPVPLDHGCNRSLPAEDVGHPGSCELTKIALAVWRAKPEAYPAIHEAFMADPPPDPVAARALARTYVSPAQLGAAMLDPWIDRIIQADIADWISFSDATKVIPKILISGKRILHGLPSGEEDFIRVMEQELGL